MGKNTEQSNIFGKTRAKPSISTTAKCKKIKKKQVEKDGEKCIEGKSKKENMRKRFLSPAIQEKIVYKYIIHIHMKSGHVFNVVLGIDT